MFMPIDDIDLYTLSYAPTQIFASFPFSHNTYFFFVNTKIFENFDEVDLTSTSKHSIFNFEQNIDWYR